MQLHSAVTSSSSLTGTPDDVPQLPVGQAPGSRGAVRRVIYLLPTDNNSACRVFSDHLRSLLTCASVPRLAGFSLIT